jgi:CubicO group peptidase (beta-lactamase class C family)
MLCVAAMGVSGTAAASEAEEEYLRNAYSAGHKALFMCSGVFVAGRTPEQIRANEFAYAADIFNAPGDAVPDYRTKSAVGTALDGKIRRVAVFRDGLGCTLMAPDAGIEEAGKVPGAEIPRASGDASRIPWPDGDLLPNVSLPPEVDEAKLRSAVDGMFDSKTYANPANSPQRPDAPKDMKTIGILIVYKGNIIAERYSDGWGPHVQARTYSAAKSVANAYAGIRVRQGAYTIDQPVNFPEWEEGDPRRKITLRHFLNMSSGLQCEGDPETLPIYFGGGVNAVAVATNRPLVTEPGGKWCYSNFDTLSLGRAVRLSLPTMEDYLTFPHRELFTKIGMRNTSAETDAFGNFITSSQIWTTPRDLARFGLLYLQDGVWNGERILPEGWVEFTRTPITHPVRSSRNWGYGAQFWLIDKNPRIPSDAFTAGGHGGNYSTIIPSKDLVIVRMGLIDGNWNAFLGDIVEAVSSGME